MVSKKKLDVYGTTQTIRKVDVRFRDERDYTYYCEKYVYDTTRGRFIECSGQNRDLGDKPVIVSINQIETFSQKESKLKFIANKFYNLYDTYEIILIENLNKIFKTKKG
jgi:hypothetical protein